MNDEKQVFDVTSAKMLSLGGESVELERWLQSISTLGIILK